MESNDTTPPAQGPAAGQTEGVTDAKPVAGASAQPIGELVDLPDFPQCAIGKQVDIGGITGLVVDVVKHSLKLRSPEGGNRSYNYHTLRKLYGRSLPPEPEVLPVEPPPPPKPEVKRELITNPDFDAPIQPVEEMVNRPDFPKCAFGQHLDLRGYTGVVVEIVNRSLKVRSREGATRSYNADGLRKLYGKPQSRP
jgi:hypothetical protein